MATSNDKEVSGIMVNQRLNEAGLLTVFFDAANKKNRDEMVSILVSIEFELSEAEKFSDDILNISDSHGF